MAIDARDGTGIKTVPCKTARMLDWCHHLVVRELQQETGQCSS
jgi:hypothetical protein